MRLLWGLSILLYAYVRLDWKFKSLWVVRFIVFVVFRILEIRLQWFIIYLNQVVSSLFSNIQYQVIGLHELFRHSTQISGWRFLVDGCEMNRDTLKWILKDKSWKKMELDSPEGDGWWTTFPRIYGRLIKE